MMPWLMIYPYFHAGMDKPIFAGQQHPIRV